MSPPAKITKFSHLGLLTTSTWPKSPKSPPNAPLHRRSRPRHTYASAAAKAKWAALKVQNRAEPIKPAQQEGLAWPSPLSTTFMQARLGRPPPRKSSELAAWQLTMAYKSGGSLDSQTDSQTAIDNWPTSALPISQPIFKTAVQPRARSGSSTVSIIAHGLALQTTSPSTSTSAASVSNTPISNALGSSLYRKS